MTDRQSGGTAEHAAQLLHPGVLHRKAQQRILHDRVFDIVLAQLSAQLGVLGNALQGYKRLNTQAFRQIKPGGILFTFSCSQAVNREQFRMAVFSAAAIAGRRVRILHQLTQPADHPVNIYHPEGEYLKGLVLYVE